ncbi:Malonyl-CoA decarboxylase (MCD) [Pseudovibrio axinellae]|uniref:Malonyl-CoA decarboxylase (MCD) n=1 Tax=Pseudovibrio axinellae TaxID=989403 RepID=A0A165T4N8_9HYPH|nr:malonyl-CoA decarboxylase [Pseudovibrio axinellae]KZL05420.1 Malonyl-CoA decarboxylase (MCD) [Pseudovibrio axinellae]SEQ00012.1 malonyl-CoA decarboxylase [Pseudovibrio axinellae]
MSLLADLLSTLFDRRYVFMGKQDERPLSELCTALMSSQGDISGAAIAHQILDGYATSDLAGKRVFFEFLNSEMDIDPSELERVVAAYKSEKSEENYRELVIAAEPKRQELARRLNQVPGATHQLVHMRKDLLGLLKEQPDLARTDLDLLHLFNSWFNRGFLVLRPISWESPAQILEKIIAYEAVHAIDSWDDLRRRLQPEDRRCFAFFHPSLPDEPLIFVEVALTKGIPASIQGVLGKERSIVPVEDVDTAVFYSISNCQGGLAGVSFGNSLIKQVVQDLSRELEQLNTFVTLSPLPTFCTWATKEEIDLPESDEALEELAASYLLEAKRKDNIPFDPVARFHLYNGALVHDVHANADTSENGRKQSAGVMVNYLYDLKKISQNHEVFANQKEIVASKRVQALAKAGSGQVSSPPKTAPS